MAHGRTAGIRDGMKLFMADGYWSEKAFVRGHSRGSWPRPISPRDLNNLNGCSKANEHPNQGFELRGEGSRLLVQRRAEPRALCHQNAGVAPDLPTCLHHVSGFNVGFHGPAKQCSNTEQHPVREPTTPLA